MLSIPTCSFNVLTRMISKRVSVLVISGDFPRLLKSCCFSHTRILLPLHARLFLPRSCSTNCAIAAYFPSFSFLTYSLSWLLSHQCMVCLCFGPGARKGWDQMVKGCCVALSLTLQSAKPIWAIASSTWDGYWWYKTYCRNIKFCFLMFWFSYMFIDVRHTYV